MNKVRTVTPEGALKKMNFEATKTITGKEKVADVLAKFPKKKLGQAPAKYPTIVMRDGIPHKIQNGVWVALTKVAK